MEKNVVAIYFSKDRPLQLELTLRSNKIKCYDLDEVEQVVICKASNDDYLQGYRTLEEEYPEVKFIEEINFRENLLHSLNNSEYVAFIVDDTVFTEKYSFSDIYKLLNKFKGIIGFSLRLGENTTNCYPINQRNDFPKLEELEEGFYGFSKAINVFSWVQGGVGDFFYPLELSSSVYRVEDLYPLFESYDFSNPNGLEWLMYSMLQAFRHKPFLSSYKTSVAFSNPINKVQAINHNRFGNKEKYSQEKLIDLFNKNYRISYEPFSGFISNGCHQEVELSYYLKEKGN